MHTKHWIVAQKTATSSANWLGPYPTKKAKQLQAKLQATGSYYKVTLVVLNTITQLGSTN